MRPVKVKLFSIIGKTQQEGEDAINKWLKDEKVADIIFVSLGSSESNYMVIFYR